MKSIRLPRSAVRLAVRTLVRPVLSPHPPTGRQRRFLDTSLALMPLPEGTDRTEELFGRRPAERLQGRNGATATAVLYLHGGGYTVGSPRTHRPLAAHLAMASGAAVHVLDYRLAPEHPYPAAVDDAYAAYCALLDQGITPQNLAIAGDSAGGGLALALTQRLLETGTPVPAALALISPWLDLSLAGVCRRPPGPAVDARARLERCAADYTGSAVTEPAVSPAFMDPAGLPRVLVHAAQDETLRGDVDRRTARVEAAGVDIHSRRFDGLWHVFQALLTYPWVLEMACGCADP